MGGELLNEVVYTSYNKRKIQRDCSPSELPYCFR